MLYYDLGDKHTLQKNTEEFSTFFPKNGLSISAPCLLLQVAIHLTGFLIINGTNIQF